MFSRLFGITAFLAVAAIAVYACSTGDSGSGNTAQSNGSGAYPLGVEGTKVEVADTSAGIALTFTTKPKNVAELQRRASQLADAYNQHHDGGSGMMGDDTQGIMDDDTHHGMMDDDTGCPHHSGMMGGGQGSCCDQQGGMMRGHGDMMNGDDGNGMDGHMPGSHVEDLELNNGARLEFTPLPAADLKPLRMHIRAFAKALQGGKCPMMSMMGGDSGHDMDDDTGSGGPNHDEHQGHHGG